MSFVTVTYQDFSRRPTSSSSNLAASGILSNRRSVAAPRFLPILQPPQLPKRADLITDDKKKKQKKKKHDSSTTLNYDRNRKVIEQISVRTPILISRHSYVNQPLIRQFSRPIRYVEPEYSYFYSNW
ncbi:unnamed protein product [Rotaria sordida]|uniref:Uncharacterized protein n=1 Tax=Rotaria sordida TaxID=392033 RepID=A0A815SSP2_9BILA|nr:unnamed protein product [Rotaria sordida]CAF1493722.1 unnamed protein product [Rotaria sordida]